MLYSGAHLIKTGGQQLELFNKLKLGPQPIQPVNHASPSGSSLDEETQGALLRFARFINQENEKKQKETNRPAQNKSHPYKKAFAAEFKFTNTGLIIDIYA